MFSGHKHFAYCFGLLIASSAKWQKEHWTAQSQHRDCGVMWVSSKNGNPDAEMNTSIVGYRSNEGVYASNI